MVEDKFHIPLRAPDPRRTLWGEVRIRLRARVVLTDEFIESANLNDGVNEAPSEARANEPLDFLVHGFPIQCNLHVSDT